MKGRDGSQKVYTVKLEITVSDCASVIWRVPMK